MDSITLCRLACSDMNIRSEFGGVFACDELPKKRDDYSCFIVNLDPKTKPGSHWVAIAIRNYKCYYFCSYASVPENKHILSFMQNNSVNFERNECRYQSFMSYTCGHFCLYFLYKFVRKQSLSPLDSNEIKK
ncbi:uncharacterized protein TNCV_272281 [Trichonephila clavipes]|nr:uncharacterized protein TNCV_272281 [Trichonephila clavipes]